MKPSYYMPTKNHYQILLTHFHAWCALSIKFNEVILKQILVKCLCIVYPKLTESIRVKVHYEGTIWVVSVVDQID